MFDPFESRRHRDIRNQLATAFLEALDSNHWDGVDQLGQKMIRGNPEDTDALIYIEDRVERFQLVFMEVTQNALFAGPFEVAGILWNARLFFECHEWLEPFWIKAEARQKTAIQALIRSAGAFVFFEVNRKGAARSSAAKALDLIQASAPDIPGPFTPDKLIQSLETQTPIQM